MNKRDAMNQIRQFGSKFDRLRNAAGGGGGGRNAPKRPKAAPNPASRKSNVFNEQVRYAWHGALQDLKSTPLATFLTVMVIAISLTLPSVCYMVYKNVSSAASQYYPSPQITVYLEKTLDDDAAARVVGQLQAEQGVDKVNYLSRDEALGEFRNWSGFGGALDMLEENPLPAVAIVVPKLDFQSTEALNTLLDGMTLTVDDTGADMRCQLARGNQAWLSLSSSAPRITLERMLSLSQSLGALLADFEREEHRSIEMGDVLTSPLQLTYALTREEWQEKWPDVLALIADVFPAYDLSGFDITSDKATFKRYFARDGQEIGAYFYAGSARVAPEDIREIRLEWGCRADKALYLAFRSPSQGKGETRNFRIAFSAGIRSYLSMVKMRRLAACCVFSTSSSLPAAISLFRRMNRSAITL